MISFRISLIILVAISSCVASKNPCHVQSRPYLNSLRFDKFTVLINGYSESRIPLLQSIVSKYAASPSVQAIVILWGNPSTSAQVFAHLSHNLSIIIPSSSGAQISVLQQSSDSLNSRFLPRPEISTRGVLVCDDDVEVDSRSVEFAFKIWLQNPDRLIGFFPRSHDFDLVSRTWIYTAHPDRYSILLTKFMFLDAGYLYKYSCEGGPEMIEMKNIVDEMHNCEDILMNFVIANEANAGPVLVGAEKARDWGDARNDGRPGLKELDGMKRVRDVGLSSRRGGHRKRRGECIREFHKVWGKMPLRYSYGKVINSVGEQGLCEKGGELVFCDEQVGS